MIDEEQVIYRRSGDCMLSKLLNHKKLTGWSVAAAFMLCIIIAVCFLTNQPKQQETVFRASIIEIRNNDYLVQPVEGSNELRSSDLMEVPMKYLNSAIEPHVGDILEIKHSGEILETYPARLNEIYCVEVVEEAADTLNNVKEELNQLSDTSDNQKQKLNQLSDSMDNKKQKLNQSGNGILENKINEYAVAEEWIQPVNQLEGVQLYFEKYTSAGGDMETRNSTNNEYLYGEWFDIQCKVDGKWHRLQYITNIGFNDIAYILPADTTNIKSVTWEWMYGLLPAGEYRIVMDVMDFHATGDYEKYYLAEEFEVGSE